MRRIIARGWLLTALAALFIAFAALTSTGCGSATQAEAATAPTQAAVESATIDVGGTLLVVRRQDAAWKLVRLTPATGAEQVLDALPFKPREALASPSGARVLYVGERSRIAVVEAATGAVQRISLAGLPVRSIDGATWTGENRFLFGGSRRAWASPQYSSLYRADVRTAKVTRFRRLAGGEPSYAAEDGSLIYVTRRVVGDTAKEAIWRLDSLTARRPHVLDSAAEYWEAGRVFDTPLISPDGVYVLSADTGTDVQITYSLIKVDFGAAAMLQLYGGSPQCAAWGGSKVAFQQSLPSGAKLAVFVYDAVSCSLIPSPSELFEQLAWSAGGDLAGGSWDDGGRVFVAAASDLGTWVELGTGRVPVWVQ